MGTVDSGDSRRNTPAICRKSYVPPEILTAYMSGDLVRMIDAKIARRLKR